MTAEDEKDTNDAKETVEGGFHHCFGHRAHRHEARFERGFRRGWRIGRHGFWAVPAPEEEKAFLEHQKTWLKDRLEAIDKRLESLNKPAA